MTSKVNKMLVVGLDVWDNFVVSYMHLVVPFPYEVISQFEFDSRVFSGEIINPEIGSIVEPQRTVKFFPATNSMHVINTHFSNNLTSIKKAIRALMPSNFITEPHWLVLFSTVEYTNNLGQVISQSFYSSTPASSSVETTYLHLLDLLRHLQSGYGTGEGKVSIEELAIIIRREI